VLSVNLLLLALLTHAKVWTDLPCGDPSGEIYQKKVFERTDRSIKSFSAKSRFSWRFQQNGSRAIGNAQLQGDGRFSHFYRRDHGKLLPLSSG